MITQKEIKQERDMLIQNTGLIWKGKNLLKLPISIEDSAETFRSLIDTLQRMEYIMDTIFGKRKGISFSIDKNTNTGQHLWFIGINFKPYKVSMPEIFELIDANFKPNGYSGTNEWKHNMCKELNIPMTGVLAYLNPSDGYWNDNELIQKPVN
ncbi:MAG TPA: hypothetical protein VKM55_00975 [Candidatus Lokiarchaeia archaeon]|nr:hypothetical protein [Candidatus Lokiarchaeia archaeon]